MIDKISSITPVTQNNYESEKLAPKLLDKSEFDRIELNSTPKISDLPKEGLVDKVKSVFNKITGIFMPKVTSESKLIPNFHKVDDKLYRGGQVDVAGLKELAQLGIRTIISFTKENPKEKAITESLGMKYINIPWRAANPPTEEIISKFFKIVDNAENQPVFIHCKRGRDRTVTMTGLYRIEKQGWDSDKVTSEMKELGHQHYFYRKLMPFLKDYAKTKNSSERASDIISA